MMATDDNPPVGVILCSDKNQTKVQFATAGLDNQLFVSRYLVALPSAEELRKFIENDRDPSRLARGVAVTHGPCN